MSTKDKLIETQREYIGSLEAKVDKLKEQMAAMIVVNVLKGAISPVVGDD